MNTALGSFVFAAAVAFAACTPAPPEVRSGGDLADIGEGGGGGAGGPGGAAGREVQKALDDEKVALAEVDARLAKARARVEADAAGDAGLVEAMLAIEHDRTARASFVAHLERCLAGEVACPPRLGEPEVPPQFDATTGELGGVFSANADAWPKAAEGIAGDACACRTATCVAWVDAALARWEDALDPAQQDAGDAAVWVTAARECLDARRGR